MKLTKRLLKINKSGYIIIDKYILEKNRIKFGDLIEISIKKVK